MTLLAWLVPAVLLAAAVTGILALVAATGRRTEASTPTTDVATPALQPSTSGPHSSSSGLLTVRRARRRGLICVGSAVVVLVGGAVTDALRPELLGIPLALTPGLAATVGLLGYALWPVSVDTASGMTTASLAPRTPWTFGRRRDFSVVVALAVVTIVFLGWAAVVADPDETGRMRAIAFDNGTVGSSSGPFPGAYYGIPLVIVTVLLTLAGYLALRRVSTVPTSIDPADRSTDQRWREAASRMITLLVTAALLGYLGGTAYCAGHAIRSAAVSFALNGGRVPGAAVGGTVLLLAGVGLVLTAVVVGMLAVAAALTVRGRLIGDVAEPAATGRS